MRRFATAFRGTDIVMALALLTRLPLPHVAFDPDRPAANAAWAYPLAGGVVGGLGFLGITLLLALGVPAAMAAGFGLLITILITGAMHEDGLVDCADGFWGGWTVTRRLEIMKDSQIGTYGVIALVLSLGLRWSAVVMLIEADALINIIWVEVLSRAGMVWVMYRLPSARPKGLSQQTGAPPRPACLLALGFGAGAALLTPHPVAVLIGAVLATLCFAKLAKHKIGGQTGDVLGATQQINALVVLCLVSMP